jgi:hypothetical protein
MGSDWPVISVRSVAASLSRRKVGAEVADEASCCDEEGPAGA